MKKLILVFALPSGSCSAVATARPAQKSHRKFLMLMVLTAALVFSNSVEVLAVVGGTPNLIRHYDLRTLTGLQFYRHQCQMGDLNNDGLIDYLMYSNSKRMAAFADDGSGGLTVLWEYTSEIAAEPEEKYQFKFLIWDIDNDGQTEVIGTFATASGYYDIQIRDGNTGAIECNLPTTIPNRTSPKAAKSMRCYVTVANLRGLPTPQDIVLLTEMDSLGDVWVYTDTLQLLWDTTWDNGTKWPGQVIHGHYPWTYDVDGDGKDEYVGKWIIDDDGTYLYYIVDDNVPLEGMKHIDRCYIGELDSSNPGVDILVSQEYYEARMLTADGTLLWQVPRDHQDNKMIVAGEFSPSDAGPEVATYNAATNTNDTYRCEDGTEIHSEPIVDGVDNTASVAMDWDGDRTRDEAYAPKRGGTLWDPLDGDKISFKYDYYEIDRYTGHHNTSRTTGWACDVYGDNREEIIICDEDEILVYTNADSNPNPRPSPWVSDVYRLLIANQMSDVHAERAFWPLATDLDGDGFIGWGDVGVISENWLRTGQDIVKGDLNGDDIVDFLDFAEFATDW